MQLRVWQQRAKEEVSSLRRVGRDRALIAACPGAGKTYFTGSIIADDIASGAIEIAVIVVPSRALKKQWEAELKKVGLKAVADVDNNTYYERRERDMDLFDPSKPVHVVTYQQVHSFPDIFATLCARHRVLAVFDEIHHAQDDPNADFGKSLIAGFEQAVFKLSLTGTPFNTKGACLAFCDAEDVVNDEGKLVKKTKTDFSYSYGEALRATGEHGDPSVVRPVTFIRWNGRAKWQLRDIVTGAIKELVFDGSKESDSLGPLVDVENPSIRKMIRAALDELEEMRQHHPKAAMLITAIDGEHCDRLVHLVRQLGVHDVVTVKYDTPGAQDQIEAFRASNQRVIVAIKMISEGVDIKRLRVGVYLSDAKTRMFFTQFIGRFIRWDDSLQNTPQFASVFIPEHVTLIKYALEIERMVDEATLPTETGTGGGGPGPQTSFVFEKDGDGNMNGAIQHAQVYQQHLVQDVIDWLRRHRMSGCIDIATATRMYRDAHRPAQGSDPVPPEPETNWSKRNDKIVNSIVALAKRKGRADLSYDRVQAIANRQVGIARKDKLTSDDVLQRRYGVLQQLLLTLHRGSDDELI